MMDKPTQRQLFQGVFQFATVLVTALLVYQKPPESVADLWQPVLQALSAALVIWGGSKIPVGGREVHEDSVGP